MRYVARKPKEGINVSDTHPLVEAGTLVIGLGAIFVLIAAVLIFLVEIALYFVPVEKEAALFENWIPEDLTTVSPTDERLYQTQMLVNRLASHWPDVPFEFRVEIDDSDISNAMALPGGLIIVTQGLLNEVESENELAFVLGHELGHFKNRDHLRALGRGIVLSVFFAAAMNNDSSGVGIKAADLTLRGFSRGQESDADAFGLFLVNQEYGHVNEAWRLFQRWEEKAVDASVLINYLSTHPRSADRIDGMKSQASDEGWSLRGEIRPLRWDVEKSPVTSQ